MTTTVSSSLHVRWLIRRDMREVLMLDALDHKEPWREEDYLQCLRQRNVIGIIAEDRNGAVVGASIYELGKRHLDIVRLSGCMQALDAILIKLNSKLSSHRRTFITITVSEYAVRMQLLLRAHGYRCIASTGSEYRFVYTLPIYDLPF